MKKKMKKYGYGTSKMHLETPAEAMVENDIAMAKAEEEAASDPWAIGMNMLGGFLMQNAGTIGSMAGNAGGGADSFSDSEGLFNEGVGDELPVDDGTRVVALGGSARGKVEVEGNEVYETKSGKSGEFNGPSHENGGIEVDLEEPTNIFSDRIMFQGVSMADRKKARLSKLDKLQKKLDKNPSDRITKNTYERTRTSLEKEELGDLQTQQLVNMLVGSDSEKVGLEAKFGLSDWFGSIFGGEEGDIVDPNAEEDAPNTNLKTSFGDMMSIGGNLFSGIAPLLNTLKQRATDTPNINAFRGFGEDALDVNEEAQGYIAGQKAEALKDIKVKGTTAKTKSRQSARSVSSMMAGDIAAHQVEVEATGDVYADFAKQMMGLLSDKSSLEMQQDTQVMAGEERRDLADRADKDAFYTAKGQDLATLGTAIQTTGKDLNQAKQQKAMKKILDQLSKYGISFDSDFNMINPQ